MGRPDLGDGEMFEDALVMDHVKCGMANGECGIAGRRGAACRALVIAGKLPAWVIPIAYRPMVQFKQIANVEAGPAAEGVVDLFGAFDDEGRVIEANGVDAAQRQPYRPEAGADAGFQGTPAARATC